MNRIAFALNRIVAPILLIAVSIGTVYVFVKFVVNETLNRLSDEQYTISDILEEIPKNPELYYFLAVFVGVCLAWRWWMFVDLIHYFRDKEKGDGEAGLGPRDWSVARGLRQRALALRTRADLILGTGLVLLLAGVYLVLFILPEIVVADRNRIVRTEFMREFGDRLGCVVKGECMIRVNRNAVDDADMMMLEQRSEIDNFRAEVVETTAFWNREIQADGSGGWTVPDREKALEPGEQVTAAALSVDGTTGIVAGASGSVYVTTDGGKNWISAGGIENLRSRGDAIVAAALDSDGTSGIVGSRRGLVFLAADHPDRWARANLNAGDIEYVTAVAMSGDGKTGLVASRQSGVYLITNIGTSWKSQRSTGIRLRGGDWIVSAALNENGTSAIVGSRTGAVFVTSDRGASWSEARIEEIDRRGVSAVAMNADGKHVIVGSRAGPVFVSTNGGKDWTGGVLDGREGEVFSVVALSAVGGIAMVGGTSGLISVSTDGGTGWRGDLVKLSRGMRVVAMALKADGKVGVVATVESTVEIFNEEQEGWLTTDMEVEPQDRVTVAALSAEQGTGIVATQGGAIFVTTDGLKNWRRQTMAVNEREWLGAAGFSVDGKTGIVAGSAGSVFTTRDSGETWNSANIDLSPNEAIYRVAFSTDSQVGIADGGGSSIYVLKLYPDMEKWNEWSPGDILRKMSDDKHLGSSDLYKNIAAHVGSIITSDAGGDDGDDSGADGVISKLLGELNVIRGVTLAVVFFLVQILVRLYQYSLRLAAFWDSRADAMLLAQSFASGRAVKFDDLVVALAPDGYDFKSPPRSSFDWLRGRRDS